MKSCWKKFPRQARLRSEKSFCGSRLALREKSSCEFKKRRNFFKVNRARDPGAVQMSAKRARDPSLANPLARDPSLANPLARDPSLANPPSQRSRQPVKRQQLSQNPRYLSLTPPRVLSIFRSGILHKRSKS